MSTQKGRTFLAVGLLIIAVAILVVIGIVTLGLKTTLLICGISALLALGSYLAARRL